MYKRTSDNIRKEATEKISGQCEAIAEAKLCKEELKTEVVKSECIDKLLNNKQKVQLNESLSLCQIIKNVVKIRMEMRNKKKKHVRRVKKVTMSLMKKQKLKRLGRKCNLTKNKKVVVDLNVNVSINK